MKKTIVLIEGGSTFETYDDYISFLESMPVSIDFLEKQTWRDSLQTDLGAAFHVVRLQMPNRMNAKYGEWKTYFQRYLEILGDDLILIGHSLGATFIVKFLTEEVINNNLLQVILIAAPFGEKKVGPSLGDFTFKSDVSSKALISNYDVTLFASDNDALVTVDDREKCQKIIENLRVKVLPSYGHFSQRNFPELIAHLKEETSWL